jgi:hypothetical protein
MSDSEQQPGTPDRIVDGEEEVGREEIGATVSAPPEGAKARPARGRLRLVKSSRDPELTPERIDEIRQRILDGTYLSLAAAEEVARRILESGDLRSDWRGLRN